MKQLVHTTHNKVRKSALIDWDTYEVILAYADRKVELKRVGPSDLDCLSYLPKGTYEVVAGIGLFPLLKHPATYYIQAGQNIARFDDPKQAASFKEANGGIISKIVFTV